MVVCSWCVCRLRFVLPSAAPSKKRFRESRSSRLTTRTPTPDSVRAQTHTHAGALSAKARLERFFSVWQDEAPVRNQTQGCSCKMVLMQIFLSFCCPGIAQSARITVPTSGEGVAVMTLKYDVNQLLVQAPPTVPTPLPPAGQSQVLVPSQSGGTTLFTQKPVLFHLTVENNTKEFLFTCEKTVRFFRQHATNLLVVSFRVQSSCADTAGSTTSRSSPSTVAESNSARTNSPWSEPKRLQSTHANNEPIHSSTTVLRFNTQRWCRQRANRSSIINCQLGGHTEPDLCGVFVSTKQFSSRERRSGSSRTPTATLLRSESARNAW